jgi:hypothetical protein
MGAKARLRSFAGRRLLPRLMARRPLRQVGADDIDMCVLRPRKLEVEERVIAVICCQMS